MSDPRRLLVATGDTHAGGTPAPMRKPIITDAGNEVAPNPVNLLLAGKLEESVEWARQKAKALGSAGADVQGSIPVVLLHNGDLTEGKHHSTHEVLVPEVVDYQIEIARDLLNMYVDALKPMAILFTRGTEAHVGKAGSLEEAVARGMASDGLPVMRAPDTGQLVPQYWEMTLGGHVIWAAHHGKVGRLPHTKGSQASLHASAVFLQECMDNFDRQLDGEAPHPIPRVIIGSHHHQKADSGPHTPTRSIQLPCWTFRNSHAHKVAAFSREDIGLAAVYCDPDERSPEVYWNLWRPRRTTTCQI